MSAYPSCEHSHNDPNISCKTCEVEETVATLIDIVARLKNALADANDYDSVAEGFNSSNFRDRRTEFDGLCTEAQRTIDKLK